MPPLGTWPANRESTTQTSSQQRKDVTGAAPPEGGAALPGLFRGGLGDAGAFEARFWVPHSLTAFVKVKARKSSSVVWPSSTNS